MSENSIADSPLADSRVRAAIGLFGGLSIAVVAVLFMEGTLRLLLLGFAVADVVVTPYILGKAVEQADDRDQSTGSV